MSLNSVLNIASSGLLTAQTQLRTVSDNVSNVSTPGYIRKIADQQSLTAGGRGAGVDIVQLRLAADRFLQAAGLKAASTGAGAQAASEVLDRAQTLFGDPTGDSSFLGGLDKVFSAFSSLASESSVASRGAPLAQLTSFLTQAQGVAAGLRQIGVDTDAQLGSQVQQANSLLAQIDKLNAEISRGASAGGDVTGTQNQQSTVIDQLSQLMDVRVSPGTLGGVVVRTGDGLPLVGGGAPPAVLSYDASGPTGEISIAAAGGPVRPIGGHLQTGSLLSLMKLRNVDLPGMGDQLSALTSGAADALNAAHNAHSAAPAPAALTGRATWLSQTEAFEGFTSGRTAVAVSDAAGAVTRRVDIDWAAGTMSVDGGAASAFSASTFVSSLNTALAPAGAASFSPNGALSLSAASGGVSVADDPAAPTSRAGKSFSGFLGLNDLVSSTGLSTSATGLSAGDASGFTGAITLRLSDGGGERLTDVKVALPAAPATMADVVSALNSPTAGAGLYGAFALDDAGRLAFTPRTGTGTSLSVVADTTSRGAGGPSLSAMFGLGEAARTARVQGFAVRADIMQDGSKLAVATFSYAAGVGARAMSQADASGADALGQAGKALQAFAGAGGLPGGSVGVSDYAAKLGADVARRAADATGASTSAQAVATEAAARRSSVEGVNLDQELVNLTTYQQAYNASARLVTVANDLFSTLLNMVPG